MDGLQYGLDSLTMFFCYDTV